MQKKPLKTKKVFLLTRTRKPCKYVIVIMLIYWDTGTIIVWFHSQESLNEAQVRDDPRGASKARGGGVQHWSPLCAHAVSEEQHAGPHKLSQQ